MTSFYWLSLDSNHVSVCSSVAAILNRKFLPAAITHVRRNTVSYLSVDCSVRYSIAIIACMGLQLLWEIVLLRSEVRRWSLDIGGTVDSL